MTATFTLPANFLFWHTVFSAPTETLHTVARDKDGLPRADPKGLVYYVPVRWDEWLQIEARRLGKSTGYATAVVTRTDGQTALAVVAP